MTEESRLLAILFTALNKAEDDKTITEEDYTWANQMLFALFQKEEK